MKVKKLLFLPFVAIYLPFAHQLDTIRTNFDDGSIARMYTVKKGTIVREGVAISYHPGGMVAVEVPYIDGKITGKYKSYYANGKLRQTTEFTDDIENGLSESFYEDGKIRKREIYKNGALDGVVEEFDENGVKRAETPFVEGTIEGKAKLFDEQGSLSEDLDFVHGIRTGYYRKYNKGIMVKQIRFFRNRCDSACSD